jgi:dTMP kinase
MFFSFDGIDGAGKSTQFKLFCDALAARGYDLVTCRDPGSTLLGEEIRKILLDSESAISIGRRSEMLLYMAARAQLVDEVIRPALDANKIVVSDRYLLANVVYQGHAGGLPVESVWQVGQVATDGVRPDCIFLLDVPIESADRRLNRARDRMESQGDDYRQRLRDGFLAEASVPDSRIHVIDASLPIEAVQQRIWSIASAELDPAKL